MMLAGLFLGAIISFIIGIVTEGSFLNGLLYSGFFEVVYTGLFIFAEMLKDINKCK